MSTETAKARRLEPKRTRSRLAKSELWLHLAMTVERWGREATSREPGVIPFEQWDDDEPLVQLCRTYDLSPADLTRICTQIGDEAERRALRCGYEDHYDPAPAS